MKTFFIGTEKQVVCSLNWADFYLVLERQKESPQSTSLIQCMSQSVTTRGPINPYWLQNPSYRAFLIYRCISNKTSVLIKQKYILENPDWVVIYYQFAFVVDGVNILPEGKLSVISFSPFVSSVKTSSD